MPAPEGYETGWTEVVEVVDCEGGEDASYVSDCCEEDCALRTTKRAGGVRLDLGLQVVDMRVAWNKTGMKMLVTPVFMLLMAIGQIP